MVICSRHRLGFHEKRDTGKLLYLEETYGVSLMTLKSHDCSIRSASPAARSISAQKLKNHTCSGYDNTFCFITSDTQKKWGNWR
jgi:hypothetical protein